MKVVMVACGRKKIPRPRKKSVLWSAIYLYTDPPDAFLQWLHHSWTISTDIHCWVKSLWSKQLSFLFPSTHFPLVFLVTCRWRKKSLGVSEAAAIFSSAACGFEHGRVHSSDAPEESIFSERRGGRLSSRLNLLTSYPSLACVFILSSSLLIVVNL